MNLTKEEYEKMQEFVKFSFDFARQITRATHF